MIHTYLSCTGSRKVQFLDRGAQDLQALLAGLPALVPGAGCYRRSVEHACPLGMAYPIDIVGRLPAAHVCQRQ
jgi:hypothetical protein